MFLTGLKHMASQIIPNTESIPVAEIAIAWELILRSNDIHTQNGLTLDEWISLYKKTLAAIHHAHLGEPTSSSD